MADLKYNYPIFGNENESKLEREATVEFLNVDNPDKNYSSKNIISKFAYGAWQGFMIGIVEGAISAVAVPTSLRKIKDRFPQNIVDIVNPDSKISERIYKMAYHSTRFPTRFGFMVWGLYHIIDEQSVPFIATNVLSLGYELFRSGRGK